MKTVTLKVTEQLDKRITQVSQKKGLNRSELIREALKKYFDEPAPTFTDMAVDLAGSIEGPSDLSHSEEYMNEYGQ